MVNIKINNVPLQVEEGTTIMDAAESNLPSAADATGLV